MQFFTKNQTMDLCIQSKKALVTGGSCGIGLAIAKALVDEGVYVTITSNDKAGLKEAINRYSKKTRLKSIYADITSHEGRNTIIEQCKDIDILINNFGVFSPCPFNQISNELWLDVFNSNVMTGIHLSRNYLANMLNKNWGRIIFISSESGVNIPEEMIHYGVSKSAQIALANGIAKLTSGTGVTVNSVLPGPTATPGLEVFIESLAKEWNIPKEQVEDKYFERVRPGSLLKRFAYPSEVAATVTYLCSKQASATNGAMIRADGGVINHI